MRPLLAFLVFALGTGLAVLSPKQPSTVQAEDQFNDWTFRAASGQLVASKNGREIWRRTGPFARPTGLQLWAMPQRVLLLSSDGFASRVFLSAYDLETGKRLWENRFDNPLVNHSSQIVDFVDGTLLFQGRSGEPTFGKVLGIDPVTGKTRWIIGQDLLGHDGTEALTLDYGTGSSTDIPNTLPLWRVNITSGKKTQLKLTIPPRTGCTAMNYQRSIPDVRFTNHYLYVFRQDSCGKFIARYDWHASQPTPLIYPDQRPPTPFPRK